EMVLLKCNLLESCHPRYLVAKAAAAVDRNLDILRDPGGWRNGLHQERARLAGAYALPRIKACVRDAPVDLISYEQGLVFLNQFHWRPRPVFQSYTAYTPYLLSANARFFQGPKAPAYLIFKFQAIDNRLPTLEDGEALIRILHSYRPVFVEKGYLLLQRKPLAPAGPPVAKRLLREGMIEFDQDVFLGEGNEPKVLTLRVKPSRRGRLKKHLYKPAPLLIQLRTGDDQYYTYRLIPDMARTGFLINPLL